MKNVLGRTQTTQLGVNRGRGLQFGQHCLHVPYSHSPEEVCLAIDGPGLQCDHSGWEMRTFPCFGDGCRRQGRFGGRRIERRYIWEAWGSTPMSNLLYQKAFFSINTAFIRGAQRCAVRTVLALPLGRCHVRDRLIPAQLESVWSAALLTCWENLVQINIHAYSLAQYSGRVNFFFKLLYLHRNCWVIT